MGRRTNVCSEQHTPLSPRKNRVRRDWLWKVGLHADIISISHGFLDAAMMILPHRGFRGEILPCDTDSGVRLAVKYMIEGQNGNPGDYPDLNIRPCGGDIAETVWQYVKRKGSKYLGVVDVDLADTIKPCWDILKPVLDILVATKTFRGKVYLTFRNGRDSFGEDATDKRIAWLRKQLPKGIRYVSHTPYRSVSIAKNALRSCGSSMCIVELQGY